MSDEYYTPDQGRYAHVCGMCGNSGRLYATMRPNRGLRFEIINRTIEGVRDGRKVVEERLRKYQDIGLVACLCSAGDKWTGNVRFNPEGMLTLHAANKQEQA